MFIIPKKLAIFDHKNNIAISNFELERARPANPQKPSVIDLQFKSNMSKDRFEDIVMKAKQYIRTAISIR